ncbi:MAG: universal stress protein [Anaerolineae bacterium]|nr:universal stress protein [Anaerolineae bacterium]
MQPFKNILIIVNDENTPALTEAATLARNTGARLTVATVVEKLSDYLPTAVKSASIQSLSENLIAARTEQLARMAAPLKDEGLQISVRVLSGTPFLEIIREVLRADHDLVMITPYEKGALRPLAFGSTILHLMRKCPCPVWAVKSPQGRFSRIMAAVDPVPADAERNSLNFKIMDIAAALARIEGAELHIWHTWVLYGEHLLKGPWFNLSSSEINRLRGETRKEHQQYLSDLLRNYDLTDVNHPSTFPKVTRQC